MASLRKHPRSPFWYIKKRNLDTDKWEEESSGLRYDDPDQTRKARRRAEAITLQERDAKGATINPAFVSWVPGYIATHWTGEGDSRRRYGVAWQAIKAFLETHKLTYPRQIRYTHGEAYIRWRLVTKVHNRQVGHNTALLELKFLSQLMNEAHRREFVESNPLAKVGIGRKAQRVKPELSDEEIEKIRAYLVTQPDWMKVAFEIALYTGCRFSETSIPLSCIDFATNTIRLRDAKRQENDKRKYFTVPLHARLRPLLQSLQAQGRELTVNLSRDKNGRINRAFRLAGVNASFHSLRVTFITRCHRGGVSESEAMRLANHSSQLVHRIYSRLNVEDVRLALSKIPLP